MMEEQIPIKRLITLSQFGIARGDVAKDTYAFLRNMLLHVQWMLQARENHLRQYGMYSDKRSQPHGAFTSIGTEGASLADALRTTLETILASNDRTETLSDHALVTRLWHPSIHFKMVHDESGEKAALFTDEDEKKPFLAKFERTESALKKAVASRSLCQDALFAVDALQDKDTLSRLVEVARASQSPKGGRARL